VVVLQELKAWIGLWFLRSDQRKIRKSFLRRRARSLRKMRDASWGQTPRLCPICHYQGMFAPHGNAPRLEACCPSCGLLERHRLIHLYVERTKPFAKEHRVLHFAPEPRLRTAFAALVGLYETADLKNDPKLTHPGLDIEDTGLPDNQYDWIICNHVLEHVNDARALAGFYRMLKPGARALITIPVAEGMPQTYEDARIATPAARLLHYGQSDHVRYFGHDVRDRIRAAGFDLTEFHPDWSDIATYGLSSSFDNTIFIATKPAT
jgi:predicted SAM-dependent methyltransferase